MRIGGFDPVTANEIVAIVRAPLPAPLREISVELASDVPSGSPPDSTPIAPEPSVASSSSAPVADGAPIQCESPLDVVRPQLDCDSAVRAALAILPAARPPIASVVFAHECFDELHPQMEIDCAVPVFGVVRLTFVGGALPQAIGVRMATSGPLAAFMLGTPILNDGQATFELQRVPPDLGCDAMPAPYLSFVIHIDPTAATAVWAVANTGSRLSVLWGSADRGLVGPPPIVVDGVGLAIARDGTKLVMPTASWPALGGRVVCPGRTKVYVTDQPAP